MSIVPAREPELSGLFVPFVTRPGGIDFYCYSLDTSPPDIINIRTFKSYIICKCHLKITVENNILIKDLPSAHEN